MKKSAGFLFLSLCGWGSLIGAAQDDYLGSWRSPGSLTQDVIFVKNGTQLKGNWVMPYDANGRQAKMTIQLEGSETLGRLKGIYHGSVGVAGGPPEGNLDFDGTFELKLSEDHKLLRGSMSLPLTSDQTQALELRRE